MLIPDLITGGSAMTRVDKGYKGVGMEGPIATWYAKNTAKDIGRSQGMAKRVEGMLPAGSRVLEIAPGPGYFSIELAKLGSLAAAETGAERTGGSLAAAETGAERTGGSLAAAETGAERTGKKQYQ